LVRSVAVRIGTFMSRRTVMLVSNMIFEIFWIFKGLVTLWIRARKSLGLVKVMDVFDMLWKAVLPREGFGAAWNGTLVCRWTMSYSCMSLETRIMFVRLRTAGITALIGFSVTVSVSNMDVETMLIYEHFATTRNRTLILWSITHWNHLKTRNLKLQGWWIFLSNPSTHLLTSGYRYLKTKITVITIK